MFKLFIFAFFFTLILANNEINWDEIKWPENLKETIQEGSLMNACSDPNCRLWDEIKDLAFCKLKNRQIPKNHAIFYVKTIKQTMQNRQIAQFLFTQIPKGLENINADTKPVFFSVCVPTNRDLNAFIDSKCPFDDCLARMKNHKGECQKKVDHQGVEITNVGVDEKRQLIKRMQKLGGYKISQKEKNLKNKLRKMRSYHQSLRKHYNSQRKKKMIQKMRFKQIESSSSSNFYLINLEQLHLLNYLMNPSKMMCQN